MLDSPDCFRRFRKGEADGSTEPVYPCCVGFLPKPLRRRGAGPPVYSGRAARQAVTSRFDGVTLTHAERLLVEHVSRGERLDLARDEPVDQEAMRGWDVSRTIRASVLRDILRGRIVQDPDPHGLRLRGARVTGRLDLEYLASSILWS